MSTFANSLGSSDVSFGKNAFNQPVISFFDPAYVRAEIIVFEPKTRYAHAVLHEKLHFLGQIPEELGATFQHNGEVHLSADHYTGTLVAMTAHLSVTKN